MPLAKIRTMTAHAVISGALLERRDDFNAMLRARIAADRAHMDRAGNVGPGYRGARASAWAAEKVQTWADLGDVDAICSECGPMVIALNLACKLLDIGAAQRTAMAVDWDEKHNPN